jgi:putative component of membrane protein insertase Oxa1/YidC/SpoIIIJ protein YidD
MDSRLIVFGLLLVICLLTCASSQERSRSQLSKEPWSRKVTEADYYAAQTTLLGEDNARSDGKTRIFLLLKARMEYREEKALPRSSNTSNYVGGPSVFLKYPAEVALRIYQRIVSPTKGRNCPMIPSCSVYSQQVIRYFGLPKGLMMTADRLHRCGHDMHLYRQTIRDGSIRFQDSAVASEEWGSIK